MIYAKDIGTIDETEMVYLTLEFKTGTSSPESPINDKLIYVGNEWVHNKESFGKFIDEMKNECDWYSLPGSKSKFVFKTAIDQVRAVAESLIE